MSLFISQILINGLLISFSYILISLGLTLIFSIMRIVNFAHGEFFMLGGYALFIFLELLHLPFITSLVLTIVALLIFGFFIEKLVFKPFREDPLNSLVISLGLAMLLQNAILLIFGGLEKSIQSPLALVGVFNIGGLYIPKERLFIILLCLILTFGLFVFLKLTKTGLSMRAVAQDKETAALHGIAIDRISSISFGIGCSLAAIAGGLIGMLFDLSPFMGAHPVMKAFIVVILGGMGSLPGVVIAGMIIGFLESFIASFLQTSFADLFSFLVLVVILILRPQGIMGRD